MKKIASRWVPQNAEVIERESLRAIAYLYKDARGTCCAVGYKGKAVKAAFHHRYGSEESRGNAINRWFAGLQRDEEVKAAVREAKKHFECSLQVGQIVYTTWGYEQTNVDFYEVVGLKGEKTVLLRELKAEIVEHSKHAMAGMSAPSPGQFCGEVFSARAASENALKIDGRKYAHLWDGRPVSCSWYA